MQTVTHNPEPLKRSPWGKIDHQTTLAPGIVTVSTSSHGGIHLDRAHQARVVANFPDWPRFAEPWYEEDCDWSLVYVLFGPEILAYLQSRGPSFELDNYAKNAEAAMDALRNWIPEAHERLFGGKLGPEDSYMRRERAVAAA